MKPSRATDARLPESNRPDSPRAAPPDAGGSDAGREMLESLIIALILAFVFRAYVVEAFVIPTGSMAPTLMGEHLRTRCHQCGYRFAVDLPERGQRELEHSREAVCPMCHYPNPLARGTKAEWGDRILVLKYVYRFREPSRWDVVVFKNPEKPAQNYIKRLVGLPGEQLAVLEGNIYVKPPGQDRWQIACKAERPRVQQEVWRAVYHSEYIPLDGGTQSSARAYYPWQQPWEPVRVGDAETDADAWQLGVSRQFRHDSERPGAIRFAFARQLAHGPGLEPYNQFSKGNIPREAVEDVRVSAAFQPDQAGLSVRLQTTARLDAEDAAAMPQRLIGVVEADGQAKLLAVDPSGGEERVLAKGEIEPFTAGVAREVALWYADQQASLWVDGNRVLRWQYDLPMRTLLRRRGPDDLPRIRIEVAGSPVALHRVRVDRDLFYTSRRGQTPARGGLLKRGDRVVGSTATLGPDSFFCLGDNSPRSLDSRFWNELDPTVQAQMFPDRDRGEALGLVPRELMIGQAFFVYFPSPHMSLPAAMRRVPLAVPDFGRMRMIR